MICKTSLLITVPTLLFTQTWVCAVNSIKDTKSQKNAEVRVDVQSVPSVPVAHDLVSVDPGRNDTMVVLEGKDGRLLFRSKCGTGKTGRLKELEFYTRKPPSYLHTVPLMTMLTGHGLISRLSPYRERLSVMAAGVNSHLLVISNVTGNDTNTYGVKVTCSSVKRRVHCQEITLVVKSAAKGKLSVLRPVFLRQPRNVSFKSGARSRRIRCKAQFAHWLFWHCENISHFNFNVFRSRKPETLIARLLLHKKQLLGTEATCYCQAIGRGALIQNSRMVRIERREGTNHDWSPWGEWGPCSSTCGNGTQVSRRWCLNYPHHKSASTTRKRSFFSRLCQVIRKKPCWSPCDENSVSLACPQEVRATNLTVEEIGSGQWNITPYLSHNSSNLKFTITISHGAFNASKSLEIQSKGFSLPDIVLKGERKGPEIKYSKGNHAESGGYYPEEPRDAVPVPIICSVPTSPKPYSITFTARIAHKQQTACTFFVTVHSSTKERPPERRGAIKSNSLEVHILIGVIVLLVVVLFSIVLAMKSSLFKRKAPAQCFIQSQHEPSHVENNASQPNSETLRTRSSSLSDETSGIEPCIFHLPSATSSENQENFFYPCSNLNLDRNELCANNTFVPEMENLSLDNAETLSALSFVDNDTTTGYCSISTASFNAKPFTRGRTSIHSQKSFGPSETFNPDRDLPSSADPRYCDYGWVDYEGGSLAIKNTGVSLHIPKYAIPRGKREIIYIALQKAGEDNPPLEDKDALLSPIVICGPDGMQFQKQVFLTIPHCAGVTEESSWNMEVKSRKDEPDSVSEWETKSSSKGSECYDTYCKVEPKECILMLDHFTRYCMVGSPETAPSCGQETNAQRKEQPPKSDAPTEGAVGGIACQKDEKDKIGDEGHRERQKAGKKFEDDQKENQAYKFVAIVAYSSPPSVDKDCAVRVYCIPNLEASLKQLDDLERYRYKGQISDAGHKVLIFYGSGENLIITDVEKFKGWELSPGSKQVEEIPFDIVWKGEELYLPPNVRFLYSRVDKDVYHFRSEYEARQDKRGARAVRLHANSSIKKQNPSSSGCSSTKYADPIKYQLPVAVRRRLCILLDPKEDLVSYWPDLAEKLGCDAEDIRYLDRGLKRNASPTDKLLELWESKKSEEIPVHKLKQILQELGRDDCVEAITAINSGESTCDTGACWLSQD